MPRLKVFRTAIGFHDAWVAAPSRRAALAAWGSDKDLFARGIAEEVTDPALTADALAQPGVVIRTSRGTVAEQLAALPPATPKRASDPTDDEASPIRSRKRVGKPASEAPSRTSPPPAPPLPKPDRDLLDAAEAALARAKRQAADALAALSEREASLARERRALERAQADDLRRLLRARDDAERTHDTAMERWRRGHRPDDR